MKITKKLAAVALTGALCFAMPAMAFADGSSEKTDTTTIAIAVDGKNVQGVASAVDNMTVPGATDALATFKITGETVNGKSGIVKIIAPKANTWYTCYIQDEKGKVTTVSRKSNDVKEITFTVPAFPVVVSLVAGQGGSTNGANGTSPQTGMDLTAPIAGGVITLATAAGAAFVLRKKIAE